MYEERNVNLERSLILCPFSRMTVVGSMKCLATSGASVSFFYPQGQRASQTSEKKSCKSQRLGRTIAILSSGQDRDPCTHALTAPGATYTGSSQPTF